MRKYWRKKRQRNQLSESQVVKKVSHAQPIQILLTPFYKYPMINIIILSAIAGAIIYGEIQVKKAKRNGSITNSKGSGR
jgi:hypothetical protein